MRTQFMSFIIVVTVPSALTAAQAQVSTVATTKPAKVDSGKMVCRTTDTTGSRLGKKRECRTAAEWAEQAALDRREVERQQASRWKNN